MPTKTEIEWTALHLAITMVREEMIRQGIKIHHCDPMDIRAAARKWLEVDGDNIRKLARDNLEYQEKFCEISKKLHKEWYES